MISVIIPTFNREEFVGDAVRSVLGQRWTDVEIIVVDDGSTDGTRNVITDIGDGRIKYMPLLHQGKPSIVRNAGITESRGNYICFLDSDDLLHEESIGARIGLMDKNSDVGIICTDWYDFSGCLSEAKVSISYVTAHRLLDALPQSLIDRKMDDLIVYGSDFVYEVFYSNIVKTSTVMIRRELLEKAGGFDEGITIGEDTDLWMRLGRMTRFGYLRRPLSYSRRHESNISANILRNFAEDERVLLKFLAEDDARGAVRKRFHRRVAEFYFDGGWHFFNNQRLQEAQRLFRRSMRFHPCAKHMAYCLISRLPSAWIGALKQIKRAARTPASGQQA